MIRLSLLLYVMSFCVIGTALISCNQHDHARHNNGAHTHITPLALANAQRMDAIKALIETGDIAQAQVQLTAAFDDDFQHPMAFFLQGLIHFNADTRERYAQSISWFEKAIATSPQWLEPRLFLARACLKDQRLQRARQMFTEIDLLAAHSAVGPYGLALIASLNGKNEQAIEYCDQALRRNEWHEAALLLRAQLAGQQNNSNQQRHYYQRLVNINPEQAEAHYALGEISLNSSRLADAQRSFERSYQLHPSERTARQLADLAVQRNDESARQMWLKRAGSNKPTPENDDENTDIDTDTIE